jgi:hypothetical protein
MASVGRRLAALVIDGLIVAVPCLILVFFVFGAAGFLNAPEESLVVGLVQIFVSLILWQP